MFLEVSLPANIAQSPDLQKNGNGSFFTQGPSVLEFAEKKRPHLWGASKFASQTSGLDLLSFITPLSQLLVQ